MYRILIIIALIVFILPRNAFAASEESPETIISAVVRREGYVCEKPIKATKDEIDSIPEEMAWILKCKNLTYKVRLYPHYLSHIEILENWPLNSK